MFDQSISRPAPSFGTVITLSIAAVGRQIDVLRQQMDGLERKMDGGKSAKQAALRKRWAVAENALALLSGQAMAMPARSLADVSVQIDLAYSMAEGMADCDTISLAHRARIEQLRVVLASAAMLLTDDAGQKLGLQAMAVTQRQN